MLLRIMFTLLIYLCESSVESVETAAKFISVFCVLLPISELIFYPSTSINQLPSLNHCHQLYSLVFELTFTYYSSLGTSHQSTLKPQSSDSITYSAPSSSPYQRHKLLSPLIPTRRHHRDRSTCPNQKNWTISFDTSRCHHWYQPDDTIETDSPGSPHSTTSVSATSNTISINYFSFDTIAVIKGFADLWFLMLWKVSALIVICSVGTSNTSILSFSSSILHSIN